MAGGGLRQWRWSKRRGRNPHPATGYKARRPPLTYRERVKMR